jgi:hypothetical protein
MASHFLIYSDYCQHSTNFINALNKHPILYESIIRINIDVDPKTKQRPSLFYDIQNQLQFKITEVPTIVINNGEYILSGVEAFKWLEFEIKQITQKELSGFNSIEMGSFSDSYATYGSNDLHNARDQSFQFVNRPSEKINTPPEDSTTTSNNDVSKKQQERDNLNIKATFQKANSNIDFTNPNFGYSNNFNGNSNGNSKQRNIESKLQELIAQREQF